MAVAVTAFASLRYVALITDLGQRTGPAPNRDCARGAARASRGTWWWWVAVACRHGVTDPCAGITWWILGVTLLAALGHAAALTIILVSLVEATGVRTGLIDFSTAT